VASFSFRNGRWQVRIRRKQSKTITAGFATKTEATKWARQVERDLTRRPLPVHPSVTIPFASIGALLEAYEERVTVNKKGAYAEARRVAFLRSCPIAKVPLEDLRRSHVDIADCSRYEMSTDSLHFRYVVGALYKRRMKPQYPLRSTFTVNGRFDERAYYLMARAITWETAHTDIAQQNAINSTSEKFKITGVSYPKVRTADNYFRDDAPPEIKALARNLGDRTSPLWDRAAQYVDDQEFVYEIKQVSFL